jgi:diguanylate cyclase (GGDEF)-like protein
VQNTLQLISIQHELGMAVGLDLRLEPMLRHFVAVCIRRLGLAGADVFFRYNPAGDPVLAASEAGALRHYFSLPDRQGGDVVTENRCDQLSRLRGADAAHVLGFEERDGEFIHYFRLAESGVLVFRRLGRPLDESILLLLKPILARLATSCRASLEHEELLHAIAARKQAEDAVVFQLHHDDLTGLPNRRLFMQRLEQELARCRRHRHFGAALFLDLDRFKTINDTLGHSIGDLLLTSVASVLTGLIRREDTVARLGGDEFVILLTELGGDASTAARHAQVVVDKIRATFSRPLAASSHSLYVTPSIGIEVFPDADVDADAILRHADMAMYQAKAKGRNNALFYSHRMSAELADRLALEKELQDAIKRGEFELYYQPQYLASREILGAEVLLRWHNPRRGMVSPALFIPVAEETGMILDVGTWMLQSACRQLRTLEQAGLPPAFKKISVNVSAIQLNQNDFVEHVHRLVKDASIDPTNLGIELTEGSLIKHIGDTVEKMRSLENLGIHFSIDDFGTGYSSLAYISRFPISTLKIDQAFVRALHVHPGNRAIVETILALGHGLGLSIIAEGVETQNEFDCLQACGCEQFQGYYFNRPMPFREFENLVRSERERSGHQNRRCA